MKAKAIFIGNILMGDDGVGIAVAEKIKDEMEKNHIGVVTGETDFEYCISMINEDDFIFIIDAALYGKSPGEITLLSLQEYCPSRQGWAQHSYGLIDLLGLYCKPVKGYIIGIEVSSVEFRFGLSNALKDNLNNISITIINIIKNIVKKEVSES